MSTKGTHCDLVVTHPAPPWELPYLLEQARQGEYPKHFAEQIMRLIVAVRALFSATPVSPAAGAHLACLILEGHETAVLCGVPLGPRPQETVTALLAVCVRFEVPAIVVAASDGKAAELAAALAVQRPSEPDRSAGGQHPREGHYGA